MVVKSSKEEIKIELALLKSKGEAPDWMNWMSYAMMKDSYLLPNQTVKERYRVMADSAASYMPSDNKEWSDKFFDLFWNNYLAPSTPVMGNLGTNRGLAVSCSASYVGDSMHDIAYTDYEIAMLSKHGFGTAALFDLRPGYAPISGGGHTNSIIDWIEKYWNTQNKVSQGSLRRGSTAIYINFWHAELLKVLPMLETHDKLHLGVICDDSVKEALKNNDPEAWKIYSTILTWRARKGKPYIIFIDNAKRQDPPQYAQLGLSTKQSNLCVSSDTEILTDGGFKEIKKLIGKKTNVWNGEEWSETEIFKTGENQSLLEIEFSNGETLKCTPYHKFKIQKGYTRGTGDNKLEIVEKRAYELQPEDKLIKWKLPFIEFDDVMEDAYTQGFFTGDGCSYKGKNHIDLYGQKQKIISFLKYDNKRSINENAGKIRIFIDDKYKKFEVPINKNKKSRIMWLAGLFDSDGTVAISGTNKSIQVSSIHKSFLIEVKRMLMTLGIESVVSQTKDDEYRFLPDGKGGQKQYNTEKLYRILISSPELIRLKELGLECNRLDLTIDVLPNRSSKHFVKIKNVQKITGTFDTYCFTEPKRNLGIFNGVLTGNCTEIFQHTDSDNTLACVLSSMVGNNFDKFYNTDAVFNSVVFLDCVNQDLIERGRKIKGLDRVVRSAERSRALGLGLLGFHTYLQEKMIPIDSFQATRENAKIFSYIKKEAVRASEYLATLLGEPEYCKGTGRRNTHLLAIAPNTSSAFMAGAKSQGIEPWVANSFEQKLAKVGSIERINPTLLDLLKSKNKADQETLDSIAFNKGSVQHLDCLNDLEKQVFKTAYEINQKVLIDLAEQRQKWICQGQSLNLFFSANEEEQWIHEVHKYAFEKDLLKSLYYVRTMAGIQADKGDSCLACEG